MASSSEDDIAASPPVENIMPPQPIMLLPKPPSRVYKTALDVINETIVKTLDSPHPGTEKIREKMSWDCYVQLVLSKVLIYSSLEQGGRRAPHTTGRKI